jgi:hypothetical protein
MLPPTLRQSPFRWPKANTVLVENAACYVGTEEYDLRESIRAQLIKKGVNVEYVCY